MDTRKLRQKILDLAIRGKLVPQDPNDEPASVLLERIRAEKQRLVNEGKIKAPRGSKTSDTSRYGNVPFDLPAGWGWTTLGSVGTWQAGGTPSRSNSSYYGGDIPWLKTGDLNDGYITDIPERITEDGLNNSSAKWNPEGSVLIAMYGATIGKVGILTFPATTNQACCACFEFEGVSNKYLFYFLMSQKEEFLRKAGGGAQPNISKDIIVTTLFPLPPIREQERITAEIEKWFSVVDRLDVDIANLKGSIANAKSAILSLAISGKLVPQDPNDEPAIELLKRINPAFKPCDNPHYENLPEGWVKCKMSDVCSIIMGQSPDGNTVNQTEGLEFHQGKLAFGETYLIHSGIYTSAPTKIAEAHSILLCVRAPVGVPNITERKVCIGRGLSAISCSPALNLKFLFYSIKTMQQYFEERATGSTFKAISGSIVRDAVIPIPPLPEQHRIVAKVEECLGSFKKIEAYVR